MKKSKNWFTLSLMISSIVLLFGLQAVWLQSLYKDARRDLRRETSVLFSSTVMDLQDSILEKNIKPLPSDSTSEPSGEFAITRDTARFYNRVHVEIHRQHNNMLYVSSRKGDSLKRFLRPLMMKLRNSHRQRGYVMEFSLDSLKPDLIKKKYKAALSKADLTLPFQLEQIQERSQRKETPSSIVTEPFPFIQRSSFYVARFPEVRLFVITKIFPQILFSLFLTTLTLGAFYLMYRNIRSNQRLIEIKNDFIGNMTHELKTPIATVSVALESLKNFNALDDPQRAQEYITIAQQELNRLSILTDKVLKTAIFESNGLTFPLEKVDLEAITSRVLDSMRLVFEKLNTKINYKKEGAEFWVNGNTDHLTNVIYNLVDNALKYSKDSPSIEILLHSDERNVLLDVKDEGLGIAAEHQKRIFEKFYRVPAGDVANSKGYGLGLTYVQSVMKGHHGEITVESAVNEGSTFTITLPKLVHPE